MYFLKFLEIHFGTLLKNSELSINQHNFNFSLLKYLNVYPIVHDCQHNANLIVTDCENQKIGTKWFNSLQVLF